MIAVVLLGLAAGVFALLAIGSALGGNRKPTPPAPPRLTVVREDDDWMALADAVQTPRHHFEVWRPTHVGRTS